MYKRVLLAVAIATSALFSPAATAALASPPGQHCVVRVTGQKASGELTVAAPRCYATFARAMQAEGVTAWGDGAAASAARSGVALASFTLGVHYDGTGYTGASTSTVGTGCTGGRLNTSAAWKDRISSTANGCPVIRHYSGTGLTGDMVPTYSPGGNLGSMNNRTESIQYL